MNEQSPTGETLNNSSLNIGSLTGSPQNDGTQLESTPNLSNTINVEPEKKAKKSKKGKEKEAEETVTENAEDRKARREEHERKKLERRERRETKRKEKEQELEALRWEEGPTIGNAHSKKEEDLKVELTARKNSVLRHGVPWDSVYLYVERAVVERRSCVRLPCYITLFLAFLAWIETHLPDDATRSMNEMMKNWVIENSEFGFEEGGKGKRQNNIGEPVSSRTIEHLSTKEDFYSWLRLGFLPHMDTKYKKVSEQVLRKVSADHIINMESFSPGDGTLSEDLFKRVTQPNTDADVSRIFTYNTLIGGIAFNQIRGEAVECENSGILEDYRGIREWFVGPAQETKNCYNFDKFGENKYYLKPQKSWLSYGMLSRDSNLKKFEEIFPSSLSLLELEKFADQMEFGCTKGLEDCFARTDHVRQGKPWIDDSTQRIIISFLTFNRIMKMWTQTHVNFFWSRTGRLWTHIDSHSEPLDPYHADNHNWWLLTALDIMMSLFNLIILLNIFKKFISETRGYHDRVYFLKRVLSTFAFNMDLWLAALWFVCFLLWMRKKIKLNDFAQGMNEIENIDKISEDMIRHILSASTFLFNSHTDTELRILLTFYTVICSFILILAFHSQPRLSFVTRTIYKAAPRLLHFVIVFVPILFTFVMIGEILLGPYSDDFSGFSRALFTMIRNLFGDHLDKDLLVYVHWQMHEAWMFYIIFLMVFTLIFMNIILAIILEAYSEVDSEIRKHKTLLRQLRELFHSWYLRFAKGYTSEYYTLRKLKEDWREKRQLGVAGGSSKQLNPELHGSGMGTLHVDDLLRICPRMNEMQAQQLLQESWEMYILDELDRQEEAGELLGVDPHAPDLEPIEEEDEREDPNLQMNAEIMEAVLENLATTDALANQVVAVGKETNQVVNTSYHMMELLNALVTRLDRIEVSNEQANDEVRRMRKFMRGLKGSSGGGKHNDDESMSDNGDAYKSRSDRKKRRGDRGGGHILATKSRGGRHRRRHGDHNGSDNNRSGSGSQSPPPQYSSGSENSSDADNIVKSHNVNYL